MENQLRAYSWEELRSLCSPFNMLSFWYLGQPYSGSVLERFDRFSYALIVKAKTSELGLYVYSPIAENHPIAERHVLRKDFRYWSDYNYVMLKAAVGMMVLEIPGWEQSEGLTAEIETARNLRIPTVYIDPKCLTS